MSELYNIFSTYVTGGLLSVCAMIFLFTAVPDSPLLGNYRKARYMIAFAYLFFVVVGIVECLCQSDSPTEESIILKQTITLVIAVSQAFMFTFAMLALVEVRFPGWRYIFLEATPVLLFITVVFATYAFCSEEFFAIVFYGFAGIYALFLVRYTLLFLKYYRRFRFRTDNYFSDIEAGRLHWVTFSFFVAFAIGIMALLSAIFMSTLVALLFTLVYDVFYTFFSIRFINYAHQFHIIERAMDSAAPKEVPPLPVTGIMATGDEVITAGNEVRATNDEPSAALESAAFVLLEKRVEKWVADKGFIEQGITIDVLASLLHTNSKYLSVYINTCKKQTFREWINGLRIEEAKTLLLQYPKMTVNDIACRSGFSDKSHFLRRFKKLTNVSTTEWKNRINR